ncbi:hypothetical protein CIB48_g9183 [Xylaria polymorpha]|nr:hypothetical protein CIB48_g9183 [Xylaria polymorpha]
MLGSVIGSQVLREAVHYVKSGVIIVTTVPTAQYLPASGGTTLQTEALLPCFSVELLAKYLTGAPTSYVSTDHQPAMAFSIASAHHYTYHLSNVYLQYVAAAYTYIPSTRALDQTVEQRVLHHSATLGVVTETRPAPPISP